MFYVSLSKPEACIMYMGVCIALPNHFHFLCLPLTPFKLREFLRHKAYVYNLVS